MRTNRPIRKRIARSLLCAAVLVGVCPSHAAPLKVMPLGDSITLGYPYESFGGYRTKLWQDFGSDPARLDFLGSLSNGGRDLTDRQHEGHSGFTIGAAPRGVGFGSLTAGLPTWLGPNVNPDVILLMIGTNDINLNNDVAGAPGRLDQLIAKISELSTGLKPAAKLIVASIPPIDDAHNQYRSSANDFSANDRVNAFNAAIPGIVAAHRALGERVFFYDLNSRLALTDIYDGLHPTRGGYDKVGDAWYAAIQSVPEPSSQLLFLVVAAWAARRQR